MSKVIPKDALQKFAGESGLDLETVTYLASIYGVKLAEVLKTAASGPGGKQALCPHAKDIVGQIWYAVNEESAFTISDFMLRRSGIGLMECQGLDAVETVGKEMGRLLNWSPEEELKQVNAYRNHVALTQKYKMG